jgi:NADPH-dependent 2,4-dienoyl-CoA reductase/sulfur reductase-like enzyme
MEVKMDTKYDYLIIGGGMTAAAAALGIREVDPKGTIGIISAEGERPYNRPPLTKKLWQGKSEEILWRDIPKERLDLILNCRVTSLDRQLKQVQDEAGQSYGYKKLLLATGGSPRRLPFAPEDTVYYRTLEDYHTVRGWVGQSARIGIIGGGFIGSEIGAALASIGEKVVMAFPDNGIGARIYPVDLSTFVTQYYQQKGVEIHPGMEIQAIERDGNGYIMRGKGEQIVEVDHIIAGIGILPNIELAQAAGIKIGDKENGSGILVDKHLRTNDADIYAAGDVASFYNFALHETMRVEHEDNALSMGKAAGQNMAGRETAYQHQPFFDSDLFDLGFEAVGDLNPHMDTFADWKEPFRKGVVYYLKDNKVRGVLLWNTWDQVGAARELISRGDAYEDSELKGSLPKP